MKITFIGTSHGVPEVNRYCQSILIETREKSFLVDAGAPVIEYLIREGYSLEQLNAVFISHMHSDHVAGLPHLLGLATWYFKGMKFDTYLPDQSGMDYLCHAVTAKPFPNDRVRLRLEEQGTFYRENGLQVTAFTTGHLEEPRKSYGFLLEAEGKRIYISGDLNHEKIDYPEFLDEEEVDVFIVECAHFPAKKLLAKLKTCNAKNVMPVHVFPSEQYEVLQEGAKDMPFTMICPNDGDTFTV